MGSCRDSIHHECENWEGLGMIELLNDWASALGTTPDIILLLIVVLASLVFFAADFRFGLVVGLLLVSGLFVLFSVGGFNTKVAVLTVGAFIALLALSLYVNVFQKKARGYA